MVLTRTVANGCGRLRTVANGCGRGRNVERTHSKPQTPRVKREPLLRIREKPHHLVAMKCLKTKNVPGQCFSGIRAPVIG